MGQVSDEMRLSVHKGFFSRGQRPFDFCRVSGLEERRVVRSSGLLGVYGGLDLV
jgi:hypothetical protein